MSEQKNKTLIIPLLIIGIMFFSIGFALGINGFLIPYLKKAFTISSFQSYLILAAGFSAFVVFGYPAGLIIKKIGYKKSMALSFLFFAIGLYLYVPSGHLGSLPLFLVASFISGIGNTLLQASVNPYITICGPIESATQRMCLMGIANKLAYPAAAVFLSIFINLTSQNVDLNDLSVPFYIIVAIFVILGILAYFAPLPEVKAAGESADNTVEEASSDPDVVAANKKTSVWQFPHLIFGALALFCYVGVETIAMNTPVDFATSLGMANPQYYSFYTAIAIGIGYILGVVLIPKIISQITALYISAILGVVCSLAAVFVPKDIAIYFIAILAFSCATMWGAIWALAIDKLGKFTKAGSSILVMAIVGGAIIPLVFGGLKDHFGDIQKAYWVCLPIYIYISWYAFAGHKMGLQKK